MDLVKSAPPIHQFSEATKLEKGGTERSVFCFLKRNAFGINRF